MHKDTPSTIRATPVPGERIVRIHRPVRTGTRGGIRAFLAGILIALWGACFPCGAAFSGNAEPFEGLRKRLASEGFDPLWVSTIYRDGRVNPDLETAALFFTYRETRLDYDQFASAESIAAARRYMESREKELRDAQRIYGVDKTVVTAVLLVETRLGAFLGNRPVINTLSTLAALDDPDMRERLWERIPGGTHRETFEQRVVKRSRWAFRELKAYLAYAQNHGLEPRAAVGSMAGALGICQFMPSNIAMYGADGNGDGRVDLFDHADAIASVAKYLKKNGWREGMNETEGGRVILHYNNSRPYRDIVLRLSRLLAES